MRKRRRNFDGSKQAALHLLLNRGFAVEHLEDRNAPASILDMSWSTSLPYAVNPVVPVPGAPIANQTWEGGHGVALATAQTVPYSSQIPQLTAEQQYAMDHQIHGNLPTDILDATDEVRLGDSLPADVPTGAKILRTTQPGSSMQSDGRNTGDLMNSADSKYEPYLSDGSPLGNNRAPNDFVYYRDNANQRGTDQGSTSTIGEPSLGSVGRANFYTGNWYASVSYDHGTNYAYVNPYSAFGDVGGAFCCDQRVAMDDDTSQLFWYLQYSKNGTSASSFGGGTIARAIGQTGILDGAWVNWNFTPASFGLGTGLWLDYPHLTVGADHLYATSNVFTTATDSFSTSVVWRILLSELQTGGTINYTYWTNTDGYTRAPLHNDDSFTTYFASIGGLTTSMKVWTQASGGSTLSQTTISGLNTTFTATATAASPDGNNWGSRSFYSRDVSAWSNGSLGGVSWNSSQGTGRPRPFIRHTLINLPALTLNSEPDIWYNSGGSTAMYGVFAADARGHYAGNYYYSADTTAASLTTWVQDDIGNVNVFAAVGTNSGTQWGDYGQTYEHINYANTWISSGYILTGPGAGGGHQPNVQTQFTWYGRERDTPAAFLSSGDVADTTGLSSTILGGDGTASRSDSLWNATTGKKDQDIFRFTPLTNTRVLLQTSNPTNGYSMDTILRLFNSAGTELTYNDDFTGLYSQIKYTIGTGGTFYAGVSGYSNFSYNPAVAGSGTDAITTRLGDYTFSITTEIGTYISSVATVSPNPRNTPVGTIDVTFSRAITLGTFDFNDIGLTLNGNPVTLTNAVTTSFVSGTTYRISGLNGFTGAEGNYVLSVIPTNITDVDGFLLYDGGAVTTSWTTDTTVPIIVDVIDISPDPRNSAVSTIRLVFSEQITGIFYSNISITRNGSPVTFTGNESWTFVSGSTYDLGNLNEETLPPGDGNYLFTINMAGVSDLVGNLGSAGSTASDAWVLDTVAPTILDVIDVAPDPRATPIPSIQFTLSELIQGFGYSNIAITLNGSPVSFSGNESYNLVSGTTYQLNGLTEETGLPGLYVFTFNMGGILDLAGNVGVAASTASDSWTFTAADTTAPKITGVSFGGSAWTAAFRAAAGDATYGFPASTGASQLASMPWSNLNRAVVKFSEPVQALVASDIRINRLTGGLMNQGTDYTFALNGAGDVLTITFLASMGTDKYLIDLDGNGGATAIKDMAGNFLAGTWTEGVSTFPTAGAAAQDFQFRYVVGVGDATRNGQVRNNDVNQVRGQLFNDLPSGTFDIFSDSNGDGLIRNVDVNTARANLFNDPPAGPGPTRPIRGGGSSRSGGNRGSIDTRFASGGTAAAEERSSTKVGRRTATIRVDLNPLDEALREFV